MMEHNCSVESPNAQRGGSSNPANGTRNSGRFLLPRSIAQRSDLFNGSATSPLGTPSPAESVPDAVFFSGYEDSDGTDLTSDDEASIVDFKINEQVEQKEEVSSSETAGSHFRFLDLPPEVRNKIYELCLTGYSILCPSDDEQDDRLKSRAVLVERLSQTDRRRQRLGGGDIDQTARSHTEDAAGWWSPQLIRTCKRIHAETRLLPFHRNVFTWMGDNLLPRAGRAPRLAAWQLREIRHLDLAFFYGSCVTPGRGLFDKNALRKSVTAMSDPTVTYSLNRVKTVRVLLLEGHRGWLNIGYGPVDLRIQMQFATLFRLRKFGLEDVSFVQDWCQFSDTKHWEDGVVPRPLAIFRHGDRPESFESGEANARLFDGLRECILHRCNHPDEAHSFEAFHRYCDCDACS